MSNIKVASIKDMYLSLRNGSAPPARPYASHFTLLLSQRQKWLVAQKKAKMDWTPIFARKSVQVTAVDIESHSILRAAQVYLAVREALVVGCGYKEVPMEEDPMFVQNIDYLSCLDLIDCLLPYIKEQTALCSALGLGQTETNIVSVTKLQEKILQGFSASFKDQSLFKESDYPLKFPKPGAILYGWLGKLCKAIMAKTQSRRNPGLAGQRRLFRAQNILFVKRGCPPAEAWIVAKTVSDHEAVLGDRTSHPDTVLGPEEESAETIRQHVSDALTILVRRIFRGKVFEPKFRFPSLRASIERGRAEGGALGHIAARTQVPSVEKQSRRSMGTYLDRMVEVRPGVVVEVLGRNSIQDGIDDSILRTVHSAALWLSPGERTQGVPILPEAICEPCKIRMITLGPSDLYQLARSIQLFLWQTIGRFCYYSKEVPCPQTGFRPFMWTTKPISEDDWMDQFDPESVVDWLEENIEGSLVSGDYKGATDNLNPELSAFTAKLIAEEVTVCSTAREKVSQTIWSRILTDCLVNHLLGHHQKRDVVTAKEEVAAEFNILYGPHTPNPEMGKQEWGQLMGSPVSFPILNLINAAATAVGLGWRRSGKVRLLDCLVLHNVHTNGDDVAFLCPDDKTYAAWGRATSAVGLAPSLGKNYRSREFLIINSELRILTDLYPEHEVVELDGREEKLSNVMYGPRWFYMNFLNLSVLFGMEAKGPQSGSSVFDKTPYFHVGDYAQALVCSVDEETRIRWMYAFTQYWRPVLDRAPANCIWEAPYALGGLGLPAFRTTVKFPETALKAAAYVACLDTKARLRIITPPSVRADSTPWTDQIAKFSQSGTVVERVVDRQSVADQLARLQFLKEGGTSATWGEFLTDFDPYDEESTETMWDHLRKAIRELVWQKPHHLESGDIRPGWDSDVGWYLEGEEGTKVPCPAPSWRQTEEGPLGLVSTDFSNFTYAYPSGVQRGSISWLSIQWFYPHLFKRMVRVSSPKAARLEEQEEDRWRESHQGERMDLTTTSRIRNLVKKATLSTMPSWYQKMKDPAWSSTSRVRAEQAFTKRLYNKVYKPAKQSSVQPMKPSTLATWTDPRILETYTLRPNYRTWIYGLEM